MANINDVFGEYDESKPMVSFNLPSREELIAELLGLIPGGRALKNFHDNPEGPASETLSLAAEDVVPLYGSVLKPLVTGEDPQWKNAGIEMALGALPIKLGKSGKTVLIKPENLDQIHTLRSALKKAVEKGEITKADADNMVINALSDIAEEERITAINLDKNTIKDRSHPFLKSTEVDPSDLEKWKGIATRGMVDRRKLNTPPIVYNKARKPIHLVGDQGPLFYVENANDANMVRHGTNYDQVWGEAVKDLGKKYTGKEGNMPKVKTKYGDMADSFNEIYKPVVLDEAVKQGHMGKNYIKGQNMTINEGKKALKEKPDYMSVDDFYKLIIGL